MQKQKQQIKVDCTAVEKQVRHNDIETDTKSQLSSTSETTEEFDTVVRIRIPKNESRISDIVLEIPIHGKRVIKSQQYSSTQSVTKDKSQSTDEKVIHEKKAVLNETKVVKTQRPNLTLYIVIAISVLLVLLFVFLWKRNLFARFFDMFRR